MCVQCSAGGIVLEGEEEAVEAAAKAALEEKAVAAAAAAAATKQEVEEEQEEETPSAKQAAKAAKVDALWNQLKGGTNAFWLLRLCLVCVQLERRRMRGRW
jgi:hypothetical protein